MKLSEHFTLQEMTVSQIAARRGWDNTPDADQTANLLRLAAFLEKVRVALGGKPISITSGYRCKKLNENIGSKETKPALFWLRGRYSCFWYDPSPSLRDYYKIKIRVRPSNFGVRQLDSHLNSDDRIQMQEKTN